ncbi:helix-turn-helix domain-containing protein [Rhizobium sp. FKY42]|uniref:helix-turn-helix domain-containing protein n=1 Tax=Rhizobium sp. FKY42 TaxID=2562310 RepID=UPI0014855A0E|nr:helix-turn-helix domain-containing protein [Rhizobium sp. FKY42]
MLEHIEPAGGSVPFRLTDTQAPFRQERWVAPQMTLVPPVQWRDAAVRIGRGCLIVSHELPDGRRQILDVLGQGRILFCSMLAHGTAKARSLTFTNVERLDEHSDRDAIEEARQLAMKRAYEHALLLGRKKSTEKVATALLDLADQFACGNGGQMRPSFTLYLMRNELADWLGLTLETVSRCLSDFKRKGVIAFERTDRITIREKTALRAIADGLAPST